MYSKGDEEPLADPLELLCSAFAFFSIFRKIFLYWVHVFLVGLPLYLVTKYRIRLIPFISGSLGDMSLMSLLCVFSRLTILVSLICASFHVVLNSLVS